MEGEGSGSLPNTMDEVVKKAASDISWANTGIAVAIIMFLGYMIWRYTPRFVEKWEKKNDSLIKFVEDTSAAVREIPVAIKSFETAIVNTEHRIVTRVVEAIGDLKDELHDQRQEEIKMHLREIGRGADSRRG